MPKNTRVRTLMGSQHVKSSKTLLKSRRQDFSHIVWSLWKKISSKNFVLVVSQILTIEEKYSLPVKAIA